MHAILYTSEVISRRQEFPDMNKNDAMKHSIALVVVLGNCGSGKYLKTSGHEQEQRNKNPITLDVVVLGNCSSGKYCIVQPGKATKR